MCRELISIYRKGGRERVYLIGLDWLLGGGVVSQGGGGRPTRAHSSGVGSGGHQSQEQAPCLNINNN